MSEITKAQLAEWERLASVAMTGPWEAVEGPRFPWWSMEAERDSVFLADGLCEKADAAFIAAAREAVPALIAALRAVKSPIPDTYACQRCGRRDGLDAVLHDDDWARVSVIADNANLLCLWCMDELAERAGVERKAVYLAFAGRYLYSESSGLAAVVEQRNAELRQELDAARESAEHFLTADPEEVRMRRAIADSEARVGTRQPAQLHTPLELRHGAMCYWCGTPWPCAAGREPARGHTAHWIEPRDVEPYACCPAHADYYALLHSREPADRTREEWDAREIDRLNDALWKYGRHKRMPPASCEYPTHACTCGLVAELAPEIAAQAPPS